MTDYKPGLHKRISSIFDGVPIDKRQDNGSQQKTDKPFIIDEQELNQSSPKCSNHGSAAQKSGRDSAVRVYQDAHKKIQLQNTPVKHDKKSDKTKFFNKIMDKLLPSGPDVDRRRQITSLILIPILSIVLIFVLLRVVGSNKPKRNNIDDNNQDMTSVSKSSIDWKLPEPYTAEYRDPMRLDNSQVSSDNSNKNNSNPLQIKKGYIHLRGIVHSMEKASAIVNYQILRAGDEIEGASITNIDTDFVEFERNGERRKLMVGQIWPAPE